MENEIVKEKVELPLVPTSICTYNLSYQTTYLKISKTKKKIGGKINEVK